MAGRSHHLAAVRGMNPQAIQKLIRPAGRLFVLARSLACAGLVRGGLGLAWSVLYEVGVRTIDVMTNVARVDGDQASEGAHSGRPQSASVRLQTISGTR